MDYAFVVVGVHYVKYQSTLICPLLYYYRIIVQLSEITLVDFD